MRISVHGTARHNTARHRAAQHSAAQHSAARCSTARCSTARCSTAQHKQDTSQVQYTWSTWSVLYHLIGIRKSINCWLSFPYLWHGLHHLPHQLTHLVSSHHSSCTCTEITSQIYIHVTNQPAFYQLTKTDKEILTGLESTLTGQEKKIEMHLSSGQESSLFPVQLLTPLVLWASWKELKVLLVQKNVQRNYVLNVYLSFGRVNRNYNSRLSHRQSNLSRTSGHRVFHSLITADIPSVIPSSEQTELINDNRSTSQSKDQLLTHSW